MLLRSLALVNLRNLRNQRLSFDPGVVAVVGRNAAGKSNLLGAAYLGCTGDLPFGTLGDAVTIGKTEGFVAAEVEHGGGRSRIEVGLAPGRKVIRIDGQAARAHEVARDSSAVLMTPRDAELVHGPPSGRRAYLDQLLSRLSPRYASLAREYQRVLEQRNAMLRLRRLDPSLDVWTERFARLGQEIDDLRTRAVVRIAALAAATYGDVAEDGKRLDLRLARKSDGCPLAEALAASSEEERARGVTLVGPHRDDLELCIEGRSVQAFGSRGEARTVALALRVAEYRLLTEKHKEPPVLLVDDFTAELDPGRRGFLLELVEKTPQALVSGTEPPPFADSRWAVAGGVVSRAA